jgi:hypothetical protein
MLETARDQPDIVLQIREGLAARGVPPTVAELQVRLDDIALNVLESQVRDSMDPGMRLQADLGQDGSQYATTQLSALLTDTRAPVREVYQQTIQRFWPEDSVLPASEIAVRPDDEVVPARGLVFRSNPAERIATQIRDLVVQRGEEGAAEGAISDQLRSLYQQAFYAYGFGRVDVEDVVSGRVAIDYTRPGSRLSAAFDYLMPLKAARGGAQFDSRDDKSAIVIDLDGLDIPWGVMPLFRSKTQLDRWFEQNEHGPDGAQLMQRLGLPNTAANRQMVYDAQGRLVTTLEKERLLRETQDG